MHLIDLAIVGIYTDTVLDSYKGKNRLEVGKIPNFVEDRRLIPSRCHLMCSLSPSLHTII